MSSTLTVTNLTATNLTDGGGTTSTFANVTSGTAKVTLYSPATSASISDSFNVSSIQDDNTGRQGVNYTSSLSSANYTNTLGLQTVNLQNTAAANRVTGVYQKTASDVKIWSDYSYTNSLYSGGFEGSIQINMAAFGDLA